MASSGLVVDASVIVKWYLRDEALLADADRVQDDWELGRWRLTAPGHFPYEVTGSLLRAARMGRLSRANAEAALADFAAILGGVTFVPPAEVVSGAADLARRLNVNFFDACYLQVARDFRVQLVTADQAFYRQAGSQPDVLWLGDYR